MEFSRYLQAEPAPVGAEPNRGERSTERLPVPQAEIEAAMKAVGEHIAATFPAGTPGRELAEAAVIAWQLVREAAPQFRGVFQSDLAAGILAAVNALRVERKLSPLSATAIYHREKGVGGAVSGLLPELIASGVFAEQWARGGNGRSTRSLTLPGLVRAQPARTAAAAISLLSATDLRERMARLAPTAPTGGKGKK